MKRALLLLALAAPAWAAEPDLKSCAAIADKDTRLACYDALAAHTAPAPAAPVAPAPAAAPSADFGLQKAPEATSIAAHLGEPVDHIYKGTKVVLDNGQVWKVTETLGGYYGTIAAGADVKVEESVFGGYRMNIAAIPVPLKVKRIK